MLMQRRRRRLSKGTGVFKRTLIYATVNLFDRKMAFGEVWKTASNALCQPSAEVRLNTSTDHTIRCTTPVRAVRRYRNLDMAIIPSSVLFSFHTPCEACFTPLRSYKPLVTLCELAKKHKSKAIRFWNASRCSLSIYWGGYGKGRRKKERKEERAKGERRGERGHHHFVG